MIYEYLATQPDEGQDPTAWLNNMQSCGWEFMTCGQHLWIFRKPNQREINRLQAEDNRRAVEFLTWR